MPVSKEVACSADDSMVAIVANRGPHEFVWENGSWSARRGVGGLVSMIEPLARQPNVVWFCCVSEPAGSEAERDALYTTAKDQTDPELNVVPVPMPARVYQGYYREISNEVLWMVQHHLVGQFGYTVLNQQRHRAWGSGYLEANRRLAAAIEATELPLRAFLIQDYHLYPLPALLRQRYPKVPSLHFVHLPFPDPAMLKLVPKAWRDTILRGLLGADVVGFQTPADVRSFLACCEELLESTVDYNRAAVIQPQRNVRVRAYATSIDPEEIVAFQLSDEVSAARTRLESEGGEFNIVRIDRLDPTKNHVLGFAAFGRVLEEHPDWRRKLKFLVVLVPSRTDATIYRDYYAAVQRSIESINAQWAERCGGGPIQVYYTNDRALAVAAMEIADVLLVNSLRGAMNLLLDEWALASRRPGVTVLSEVAGVRPEVRANSLPICPLDIEGTADAIAAALIMPREHREARLQIMRDAIAKWTARDWLEAQLKELGVPLPNAPLKARARSLTQRSAGGESVEQELEVLNAEGIHARPAAAFVRCARDFESTLEIIKDGVTFPAQSILAVLTANLNRGARFTLRATGPDAQSAIERMSELLRALDSPS